MFATWSCNKNSNPFREKIRKACQCRQLEYRKHLNPKKIQEKYEACLKSIPNPVSPDLTKISLGNPVGATFGTIGIEHLKANDVSMQSYACCLIAFGMAFIIPEKDWNCLIINQILQDGKKLIEASVTKDEDQTKLNEISINKRFVINNTMVEIDIFDPEYTGKIQSTDFTVPMLLTSLKKFFQYSSYGLLWFGNGVYYFIWKNYDLFFIWDSYGRDQETLIKKSGYNAALIAVRCPENLYYYIINLGNMNSDEMYSIRKLQMSMIIPYCNNSKMNEIRTKSSISEYQIISEKYAILRGHTHVGSICFKEFRYKQSLAVAMIALLYSKISPPCAWDRLIIDEIVILGTIFYKVWNNCAHCFDLVIYDVAKQIRIGQYIVDISIDIKENSGEWKCVSNYKRSSLTKAIKKLFLKSVNILLQIESKTYAIWKRNDMYYIFDPYEHQANRGEIERYKSSMLHMCSTVNQCCLILTQLILEIPTVRNYSLHSVRILNIADCRIKKDYEEGETSCMTRTSGIQDNEEVKSLNESIEDLECQKMFDCLGDFYDEDNISLADLNSPGMSETQIPKDYFEIQDQFEREAEMAEAERKLREEIERKLAEKKTMHKEIKEEEEEIISEEEDEEIEDANVGMFRSEDEEGLIDDTEAIDFAGIGDTGDISYIEDKESERDTLGRGDEADQICDALNQERKDQILKGICDESTKIDDDDENLLKELTKSSDTDEVELLAKVCKSSDKCAFNEKICKTLKTNIKDKEIYSEKCHTETQKELRCPAISPCPKKLAVIGTEKPTHNGLCNLLKAAFKCTDRLIAMTKFGNYIVFKSFHGYYLYDGCTCNIEHFRYLDLSVGTAGFIHFKSLDEVIKFIISAGENRIPNKEKIIEDICKEYGS